jgi:hypothetical protein
MDTRTFILGRDWRSHVIHVCSFQSTRLASADTVVQTEDTATYYREGQEVTDFYGCYWIWTGTDGTEMGHRYFLV